MEVELVQARLSGLAGGFGFGTGGRGMGMGGEGGGGEAYRDALEEAAELRRCDTGVGCPEVGSMAVFVGLRLFCVWRALLHCFPSWVVLSSPRRSRVVFDSLARASTCLVGCPC